MLSFFKLPSWLSIGWRDFTLPHTFLIASQRKQSALPSPMSPCSAPLLPMSTSVYLVVLVIPTCPLLLPTAPRSTRCVFLGYSSDHKGYRRLDLSTNCILISRHVVFDEADLPFSTSPHPTNDLDFLSSDDDLVVLHIGSPFIHRYPIVPGVA
jgi:hypothetical protein